MSELQRRYDELLSPNLDKKKAWGGAPKPVDAGSITSQVVDLILEQSIIDRASDIHIEPEDTGMRVRYRIDGQLYEVLKIDGAANVNIMSRIKIMSALATDAMAKRKAQDGRFSQKIGASTYDFRVSTFPLMDGEKVAIRILSEGTGQYRLDSVGLDTYDMARVFRLLQNKYGLLLVCGPTGSGKTTTLYSMLNEVNSPKINIVTLEDPVEYQLKGINQCDIKTKSDFHFADGLKAILRQDPNIIFVGEMRDMETSEIAIRSSMTGHLVLSSIHANNAIGTVIRLINMGLEPYMVSYAMIGAVAQRLVRRICDQCITSYVLTQEQVQRLTSYYGIPLSQLVSKPKAPTEGGVKYIDYGGGEKDDNPQITFFKGKGCDFCRGTGYRGRVGIFEIAVFDNDLRDAILKGVSSSDLQAIAVKNGMKRLSADALEKVKRGVTTIDEVSAILLEK